MNKLVSTFFAGVGLLSTCGAADLGFGVSAIPENGFRTIYFPVRTGGMLIEGSLTSGHGNQSAGQQKSSYTLFSPGVGVFWLKSITENSNLYLGSRISYIYQKNSSDGYGFTDQTFHFESKNNGYSITPTLGFEYFPIKHLSLGGEVSYSYSKMNIRNVQSSNETFDGNSKGHGTNTDLIIRWYF